MRSIAFKRRLLVLYRHRGLKFLVLANAKQRSGNLESYLECYFFIMNCKLRLPDRHRRKWKIVLTIFVSTIFHNEVFVYWRDSTKWPYLSCEKTSENDCQKLLVVADPQILGPLSEPLSSIGYMDTDLYVYQSKLILCYLQ